MTTKNERRNKLNQELADHAEANKVSASVKLFENFMLETLPMRAENLRVAGLQMLLINCYDQHAKFNVDIFRRIAIEHPEIKAIILSERVNDIPDLTQAQKSQLTNAANALSAHGQTMFHTQQKGGEAEKEVVRPQNKPKV